MTLILFVSKGAVVKKKRDILFTDLKFCNSIIPDIFDSKPLIKENICSNIVIDKDFIVTNSIDVIFIVKLESEDINFSKSIRADFIEGNIFDSNDISKLKNIKGIKTEIVTFLINVNFI